MVEELATVQCEISKAGRSNKQKTLNAGTFVAPTNVPNGGLLASLTDVYDISDSKRSIGLSFWCRDASHPPSDNLAERTSDRLGGVDRCQHNVSV